MRALERKLRDRRFDGTVRRAVREGQRLSPAQIDRMVDRYRDRYIKYRSEVIARTEAIRAVQGGQQALLESYVADGRIARQQIRRFWHYSHDGRTRSSHRAIPGMNQEGVGMEEAFKTPLGPLKFPGDPNGRAENTINCRCTAFPRIVAPELMES